MQKIVILGVCSTQNHSPLKRALHTFHTSVLDARVTISSYHVKKGSMEHTRKKL